ncbi:COG3014 family protein [Thalassotalea atypica]|uniref:COG3014 family protein n=1 Tax=Thalassotalea atypica TaxID=2054316 RepID=UPI0025745C14|nr:hypothetical protein [Thalassotalea atypica]
MRIEDFFQGYAQQMRPVRQATLMGDFPNANQKLGEPSSRNTNYVLTLLEKGRLAYLSGNFQQSRAWFEQAYQTIEKERSGAKVRLSSGVEKFGSLLSNDNAILYQVPAYEQSMMHSYQALNYLYLNDLEGALVEIRRANLVQEQALRANEDELIEANEALGSTGSVDWQHANAAFSSLNSRVGDIKNGFQNAYTFYISGILYEAAGQLNDAYIDYKKALEIFPDNHYLQQDVLRLAHQLGMVDDIEVLERRFGDYQTTTLKNSGQLVIIYEQDLIDARIEKGVNLPIFTRHNDFRTFNLALPSYQPTVTPAKPLVLKVNDDVLASEQIVQLQALVAKQLTEQMPTMIARQVLRLAAKEQVRHKLSKEGGDVGNILAGLYNMASERADTRSWLTLPSDVQLLKIDLVEGQHRVNINAVEGLNEIPVDITAGRTTFVMISRLGQYSQHHVVNL